MFLRLRITFVFCFLNYMVNPNNNQQPRSPFDSDDKLLLQIPATPSANSTDCVSDRQKRQITDEQISQAVDDLLTESSSPLSPANTGVSSSPSSNLLNTTLLNLTSLDLPTPTSSSVPTSSLVVNISVLTTSISLLPTPTLLVSNSTSIPTTPGTLLAINLTAPMTSTLNSTTIPTSTLNQNVSVFGVCSTELFTSDQKKTTEVLLYVGSGWVLFWCSLAALVNLCCRTVGFHRFLDFMQEVGIIVTFVFLGFFVLRPNWSGVCKSTQIVLHAAPTFVLTTAIVQAIMSASLVRGGVNRTRGFVAVFLYLWPFVVAAGFTCGVYFTLESEYENNGVHCFSQIFSKMFWTFSIPFAILVFVAVFVGQLSFTACDMSRDDVHQGQLFWAKKTCRGLPLLLLLYSYCFFTLLFALDMQLVWLAAVYVGLCVLFGLLVFVLHTYCYRRTARVFWRTRLCFYKPCPQKQVDVADGNENSVDQLPVNNLPPPLTEPLIPMVGEKVEPVPQVVNPMSLMHPPAEFEVINPPPQVNAAVNDVSETSPEEFYRWVTNPDDVKAENVLFRRYEAQ